MAFRAWHDYRHITENAEFDDAGERKVNRAMAADLYEWLDDRKEPVCYRTARAAALLRCENIGQLDYWRAFGSPPDALCAASTKPWPIRRA